jgi:16S rRNA C967 or C1407 C5-methylase (RsmB/RsmF family)
MKGRTGFEAFFSDIYQDNWETIYQGLKNETQKISFDSKKYHEGSIEVHDPAMHGEYALDYASLWVAQQLPLVGESFLDMCAAPGGKSLALLCRMQSGTLTMNELSAPRRGRLKKVIAEFSHSAPSIQKNIWSMDAGLIGIKFPNQFDAILVDAPCSSERHLVHDPKELETWSVKRTKSLAQRQYRLLCSAYLACKIGGYVLYSTCSISPYENEEVIDKLITKKNLEVVSLKNSNAQTMKYGVFFLPHESGFGPMYSCLLRKVH